MCMCMCASVYIFFPLLSLDFHFLYVFVLSSSTQSVCLLFLQIMTLFNMQTDLSLQQQDITQNPAFLSSIHFLITDSAFSPLLPRVYRCQGIDLQQGMGLSRGGSQLCGPWESWTLDGQMARELLVCSLNAGTDFHCQVILRIKISLLRGIENLN